MEKRERLDAEEARELLAHLQSDPRQASAQDQTQDNVFLFCIGEPFAVDELGTRPITAEEWNDVCEHCGDGEPQGVYGYHRPGPAVERNLEEEETVT